MSALAHTGPVCTDSEGITEEIRYDVSIYDTPFSKLPEPKRVWLGSPSSELEGLGKYLYLQKLDVTWLLAGRLSLLTPEIVSAAAASEIKTGRRVSLNWNLQKLEYSQFGRQSCGHKIIPLYGPGGIGLGACFDDAYDMNPRMLKDFQVPPNLFRPFVMSPEYTFWHPGRTK